MKSMENWYWIMLMEVIMGMIAADKLMDKVVSKISLLNHALQGLR